MNIFGLAGASAKRLLTGWGSWTKITSTQKFHDDLKVLIETERGTMIGDPEFGSNVHRLLFEPATNATASMIRTEVVKAIERYYTNVIVQSIDVTFTKATIRININYIFVNSNIGDTLMLEFIRGEN